MSWTGIGYDYRGGTQYVAGNWTLQQTLDFWNSQIPLIKAAGLNSVRLSFAFPDSGGTTHNFIDYTILDAVLALLNTHGLKAILDLHNWNDMYDYFGSPAWVNAWVALVNRFKNDPRIAAWELFNEPSQTTWAAVSVLPNQAAITGDGAGYYDGSEGAAKALAACVDAIRATGDTHPIVYPDPYFWRTWEDAWTMPSAASWVNNSAIYRTNIVVTWHKYANDLDNWNPPYPYTQYESDVKKAMLAWKSQVTIWFGEFGLINDEPNENTFDTAMIAWCKANGIGFSYWMFGPYPNGLPDAWAKFNSFLSPSPTPSGSAVLIAALAAVSAGAGYMLLRGRG